MIQFDTNEDGEGDKSSLLCSHRTKNDEAKQRKIAVEYVNLCGYERGGDRKSKDALRTLKKLDDIASELGVSTQTLKEMLAIERKLTPEMKDLLNKGLFTESTASRVIAKLTPEEQEELVSKLSNDVLEKFTRKQVQSYVDQIQAKDNKISGYEMMMEEYQKPTSASVVA